MQHKFGEAEDASDRQGKTSAESTAPSVQQQRQQQAGRQLRGAGEGERYEHRTLDKLQRINMTVERYHGETPARRHWSFVEILSDSFPYTFQNSARRMVFRASRGVLNRSNTVAVSHCLEVFRFPCNHVTTKSVNTESLYYHIPRREHVVRRKPRTSREQSIF